MSNTISIRFNADGTRTTIDTGPAPVPAEVTRFQARAALQRTGRLAAAQAAATAAGGEALLAWNDAVAFSRTSPTLNALAQAIGLTPAQVDDLFRLAATIEA